MRSSSCVCQEWNQIILSFDTLFKRKTLIDFYEPVREKYSFGSGQIYRVGHFSIDTVTGYVIVSQKYGNRVHLFEQKGDKLIKSGRLEASDCDIGEIYMHDSKIYVMDTIMGKTRTYDLDFNLLNTLEVDQGPHTVFSREFIISITQEQKICVLDLERKKKSEFTCSMCGRFSRAICVNSKGQVIVASTNEYKIYVFDLDGRMITQFSSGPYLEHDRNKCIIYQYSVSTDSQDNILVTDVGHNKINVFTSEGILIKEVGCGPISPIQICTLGTSMLVSYYEDNCIRVFSN